MYRAGNTCVCPSRFYFLFVNADMCFYKPVTNEVPQLLLLGRYFKNMPFENRHNM
jgi:hypothetical protein